MINALYFCITTLSTVGHPSFEPQTTLGKMFTMIYIIVGTGLFLGMIGHIAYAPDKATRKLRSPKSPLCTPTKRALIVITNYWSLAISFLFGAIGGCSNHLYFIMRSNQFFATVRSLRMIRS
ncbi:hypothetical protein QFZ78_002295 [Paenibacillus sp. V4I5]|nr:hypothetical protein [Paenibacillus sp. V4I5]